MSTPAGIPLKDEHGTIMHPLAYDCLGCLMAAHQSGAISDDDYQEVFDLLDAAENMFKDTCPKCGAVAYISEIEWNAMHCPGCGWYSIRESTGAPWTLLRPGPTMERRPSRKRQGDGDDNASTPVE